MSDKTSYLKHTGWKAIKRKEKFEFDLETTPLEVKTDSTVGNDENVHVAFFSDTGSNPAGGFLIQFYDMNYIPVECSRSAKDFQTTASASTDKIWRITLKRTSDVPRILIHCNDVKVLDVELSSSLCDGYSTWSNAWSRKVGKIRFNSDDTASDGYRAYIGEL